MASPGRPPKLVEPGAAKAADHDLAPRLSFPLTRDKKRIAFKKLQEKTRDQLREVLADPELASELGVTPIGHGSAPGGQAAAPADDRFPPELCGVIFDALSMLAVALAGRRLPADVAAKVAITDEDKRKLNGPTAAMIDKYAPGGLAKYETEAAFALAVGQVIAGKLALVRAAQAAAAPPAPAPLQFPQQAQEAPAVNT